MKNTGQLIRRNFDLKGSPFVALSVGVLFLLEMRYGLRKRTVSQWKRLKTNTAMAGTASLGLRLILIPALVHTAVLVSNKNTGLPRYFKLPPLLRHVFSFLLLDYGNYRWHKLNHSSPFLWRFHQVHHSDLDLDVSTALRFHIGEMLASVFYRAAWIAGTGAAPGLVLVYEVIFEACTAFHHSNLRLPENTDRALGHFMVTPRMHGIHHSIIKEETDSNFCIIFSFWDRLHQTIRLNIPQNSINIGVPYIRHHQETPELLLMPASPLPEWKLPGGKVPERTLKPPEK